MMIHYVLVMALLLVVSIASKVALLTDSSYSKPACCSCGSAVIEGVPGLPFGSCGCSNEDFKIKTSADTHITVTDHVTSTLSVKFEV
jgi:hypothetical protein